jgi:hypothetical protein
MSFILNLDLIEPSERAQHQMVYERARAAGTPFMSYFSPTEIIAFAHNARFKKTMHISRSNIIQRYFLNRADGLVPSSGEEVLIAIS